MSNLSVISDFSPEQWEKWLTITDDTLPFSIGRGKDLFVGTNKEFSLTLFNTSEIKVRDIVVLGTLNIISQDPENTDQKPKIFARDVVTIGTLNVSNISIKARKVYTLGETVDAFRKQLQDHLFSWYISQSESAEKMGVRSIFSLV